MKLFGMTFTFNGYPIFHKGNMGVGSGLDAETVAGKSVDDTKQDTTAIWTAAQVISKIQQNNVVITTSTTQPTQSKTGDIWIKLK